MIGADDLDITGITVDGEEVPSCVNGQWTWEEAVWPPMRVGGLFYARFSCVRCGLGALPGGFGRGWGFWRACLAG